MKKRAPFKLKSGNKPSMAKIAGVSPMKQKVEFDPKKSEKVGTKQKYDAVIGLYGRGGGQENKTITDKLKEYRKAMETPPNKRTKAQKELIMKINEQRTKEQNKVGMNIDEID